MMEPRTWNRAAYIRWERIKVDWKAGYRPRMIAFRENERRECEGEARRITALHICRFAYLSGWDAPWKETG